jgi:hypothetical protein
VNEITLPDGSTRRLGNIAPKVSLKYSFPVFGTDPTAVLIPRSEWDARLKEYESLDDFDPFLPPVHDQNDIGQCNPEAATGGAEYMRNRQGLPYVKLSAADLYARINGGVDEGSLLEDAMQQIRDVGVGTAATSGVLWKNGSWKGPASAAERAKYKVTELYLCPTFDHQFSAALQGFVLVNGVLWADNYTPNADGWLPTKPSGNVGGHAIMGYKPTKATQHGNTYGIWHQNSWGTGWGKGGRFAMPEALYDISFPGGGKVGGWWAVRQVVDEGV